VGSASVRWCGVGSTGGGVGFGGAGVCIGFRRSLKRDFGIASLHHPKGLYSRTTLKGVLK
jgi:hypothetical protein